jgi:hypothetical protein
LIPVFDAAERKDSINTDGSTINDIDESDLDKDSE